MMGKYLDPKQQEVVRAVCKANGSYGEHHFKYLFVNSIPDKPDFLMVSDDLIEVAGYVGATLGLISGVRSRIVRLTPTMQAELSLHEKAVDVFAVVCGEQPYHFTDKLHRIKHDYMIGYRTAKLFGYFSKTGETNG